MAAKILWPGPVPGVMNVAKVTFGAKSSDNPDVLWPATDISIGTVLFKALPGTFIKNVIRNIRTGFGSTGAFIMNVGDGTDPDGWIESTDQNASDAGMYSVDTHAIGSTGATNAYAFINGKLCSTGNTLDTDGLESVVVATVGAHPLNLGLADFYVMYFFDGEVDPK
jgi:hypothetical protein